MCHEFRFALRKRRSVEKDFLPNFIAPSPFLFLPVRDPFPLSLWGRRDPGKKVLRRGRKGPLTHFLLLLPPSSNCAWHPAAHFFGRGRAAPREEMEGWQEGEKVSSCSLLRPRFLRRRWEQVFRTGLLLLFYVRTGFFYENGRYL